MSKELRKKQMEYRRVELAIFEREDKIQDRLEEIEHLKKENKISASRLEELKTEISDLKE